MEHKRDHNEECIVATYCNMPKGISWAEATLKSEKIKCVYPQSLNDLEMIGWSL